MGKFHFISTFDYEIFGDGNGCLQKCLLNPMQDILDTAEQVGSPQTFFVDLLEFASFRQASLDGHKLGSHYPDVEQQLTTLTERGHNIQWHLHPQWLDAAPTDDGWTLDLSKWRIGDLSTADIDRCFAEGLRYAETLKLFEHPRNGIVFRAGGWAIQPSTALQASFEKYGIIMDSTVAPGAKNLAKGDWFDFSRAPKDIPYWPFSDNVCESTADQNNHSHPLQIPIATEHLGRKKHIQALKESRATPGLPCGCIGSYAGPNNKVQEIIGKISKVLNIGNVMFDTSTLPGWALIDATEQYMQRYKSYDSAIPIVSIGHNKNFTKQSQKNFQEYLGWLSQHPEIEFSSYDQWYAALDQR